MPTTARKTHRAPAHPTKPTGVRFLVEPHEGKPRIFGIMRDLDHPSQRHDLIFAVATLPGATTEEAVDLAWAMNQLVVDGTRGKLDTLLEKYPPAVRAGVRDALPGRRDIGRHTVPDFATVWRVPTFEKAPDNYYDTGDEILFMGTTPRTAALLWVEAGVVMDQLITDLRYHDQDNDLAVDDPDDKYGFIQFDALPECTYGKTHDWRKRTLEVATRIYDGLARGELPGDSLCEKVLWREIVENATGWHQDMGIHEAHSWIMEIPAHPRDWNFDLYDNDDDEEDLERVFDYPRDYDLGDAEWFGELPRVPMG